MTFNLGSLLADLRTLAPAPSQNEPPSDETVAAVESASVQVEDLPHSPDPHGTFTPAPPRVAPHALDVDPNDIDALEEHEAAHVAHRAGDRDAETLPVVSDALPPGTVASVVIRIPSPRETQRPVLDHPARFKMVRAGRRYGKTRLEFIAAVRGHGPIGQATGARIFKGLAQGGDIVWIAPDFPQSDTIWEEEILPRFFGRAGVTVSEKHRLVGLGKQLGEDADGEPVYQGTLRIRSAENINSVRGKKLDGIIIDEAAFMKLLAAWRRVLRPTLIDRAGWAIIASTTDLGSDFNGMIAEVEAGKRGPNWHAWHFRTRDNPYVSDEEKLELSREYVPGTAEEQQELDAELLETLGTMFREEFFKTYDAINTQAVWIDGLRYEFEYLVMTVDVAASLKQLADFTSITVAGVCWPIDGIRRVAVIENINERLEGPDQITAMQDTALRYRPRFIDIEAIGYQLTAVQHLTKALTGRGLAVEGITLKGDKRQKAVPAAAAIARGEWYFPQAAPWLVDFLAQLLKFPNGKTGSKLVADHDDIVDTLSLLAARVGGRANSTWKMRKIRGR